MVCTGHTSSFSSISNNSRAEQRVASDDFQILDDLNAVLSMDRAESDPQATDEAGAALDMVRDSIGQSDDLSPIHGTDNLLSGLSEIETTPPEVIHPRPYQILTNPNEEPPGRREYMVHYTQYHRLCYLDRV